MKKSFVLLLATSMLMHAESVDEALEGFDDTSVNVTQEAVSSSQGDAVDDALGGFDDVSTDSRQSNTDSAEEKADAEEKKSVLFGSDLTGSLSELVAFSYHGEKPHNALTVAKTTLYLDYEHKFANGWKFKTNAKAYYDLVYDLRDGPYTEEEKDAYRSEVRLYDAYLEGSLRDDLDFKIGRQVVVWGRSDTIRITDVLNPLDNRRPALVDIEDLRLPVGMAKLDYYLGKWRVTPIAIFEQQFTLNPPYGSAFYPAPFKAPDDKSYHGLTYALSVGGEFSGWDVNFYAARIRQDSGYIPLPLNPASKIVHKKITMQGAAFNYLSGSWLLKGEVAHFDGLKYTFAPGKSFDRTDALIGIEYNGIADTMISYDFSVRHIHDYNPVLLKELQPLKQNTYQHAFRVRTDFLNATLHANYLISLFGNRGDEGGFQRLWGEYEINDDLKFTAGVIDYIGGSKFFDKIHNNDMLFMELSYSF